MDRTGRDAASPDANFLPFLDYTSFLVGYHEVRSRATHTLAVVEWGSLDKGMLGVAQQLAHAVRADRFLLQELPVGAQITQVVQYACLLHLCLFLCHVDR